MRMPARPVALAARLALGAVFVVAAAPKIADPGAFAWAVARYDLAWVPAGAVAVFLPWLELFAGLAILAVPALRRGGLAWAALLLGGFAVAGAAALLGGLSIPCGCFSLATDAAPLGWGHVAATLAGAVAAAGLARAAPGAVQA
ncbi:MAG: DoxX family protein [Lentisphaerae bacterium]|nr:DoxX family protein [Lentisphaerota bacterium]